MIEILPENNFYLYRHIREDKNEPFYMGIGSQKNYTRAKIKRRFNPIWNNIVAKTEWYYEIMLDDLTKEEAIEKEKEFITLYGQIGNKTGILTNLTKGGEGIEGYKHTRETRKKMSNSQTERWSKIPYKRKQKIKLKSLPDWVVPTSIAVVGLSPDGTERTFSSMSDAARILKGETNLKFYESSISLCCAGKLSSHKDWKFKKLMDNTSWDKIIPKNGKPVKTTIIATGEEKTFESVHEACRYYSKLWGKRVAQNTATMVCNGQRNHHAGIIFKYI